MKAFKSIIVLSLILSVTQIQSQELETVIQRGHLGAVKIAEFSPDGTLLITGGRDKTAKLWEVSTGREIRSFLGHEGTILAAKFTPDGKYVATGGTDNTVKLWDITNAELKKTFTMKDRVTSMDFTSNGKHIVIGGYDWEGKVFDLETGEILTEFKVNPNKGTGTGVSTEVNKDNSKILVAEDNRKFSIVDLTDGEKRKTYNSAEKGSAGGVGSYAKFLPDGNFVIHAAKRGPLCLWDISKEKKIKTYMEDIQELTSVDVNSDGSIILVSDIHTVILFDKQSGKKIRSIKAHEKEINFAGFSPDGSKIITASDDGTAVLWKTQNGKKIRTFVGYVNLSNKGTDLDQESYWDYYAKTYFDRKTNVKLSPNGKLLIIGKQDSIAKVMNFETGRMEYDLKGHSAAVISFDFSPDSKLIATGSGDKRIKIWNAQDGTLIRTIKGHRDMVFSVHFSKDGKHLLSSGWDGNAYIWNVETGEEVNWFKDVKAFTSDFSPFGNYIVTGGLDKHFSLWEQDASLMFRRFIGHTDVVSSFDFYEEGKTIVSGSWDGTVCVWDFISGFQLMKIKAKQAQIHSVAFSNYGKYIFSGGLDGTIKMWEASSGRLLKTFKGHNSAVTSLQVSPDNQTLISCSIEGVVKVWEIINAKIIYTYYQLSRDDWFVKGRGGFFDGNSGAKKYIYYVKGTETYHVDQFFEDFYRPGLLQHAYQTRGLINENMNLYDYLENSPPPSIKFTDAAVDTIESSDILELNFQVIDNGGGVDEIKVLQNGKRIIHEYSNSGKSRRGKKLNESIQLLLIPGENTIQISAFSKGRIESNTIEQSVYLKSNKNLSDCHILVVGIDKYKNQGMDLNYAKADAKAFSDIIKKRSKALFNNMNFYNLYDYDATKINILNAIDEISKNADASDVFIFYYAGHGSMLENNFFFIPTDCIRLYDEEGLQKDAILAQDMQDHFNKIKALKQIMILDACQSGGATEILGQRGAGREKAIAQLSRSSGIHVLASAGSEQFAIEFKSLGHGLFTYVLLDAIGGSADGAPLDGKITIYELKSYLDDQVPEYTKKFKGIRQYPQSYSGGNDFPLAIE